MTPDQMLEKLRNVISEYADSQVVTALRAGDTVFLNERVADSLFVGTVVVDQDEDPLYKTASGWVGPNGSTFKSNAEVSDYASGPCRILNLPADDLR